MRALWRLCSEALYLNDLIGTDPRGGLHQRHHAAAPPQAPPGALVGVISALSPALQVHGAPLAPVAAEVEWNVHTAPKSCSWTASIRCGSSVRMNEEKREQVVALLTRIGMMAEDLNVIALGGAGAPAQELSRLIDEAQRRVSEMEMLSEQAASIIQPDNP